MNSEIKVTQGLLAENAALESERREGYSGGKRARPSDEVKAPNKKARKAKPAGDGKNKKCPCTKKKCRGQDAKPPCREGADLALESLASELNAIYESELKLAGPPPAYSALASSAVWGSGRGESRDNPITFEEVPDTQETPPPSPLPVAPSRPASPPPLLRARARSPSPEYDEEGDCLYKQ